MTDECGSSPRQRNWLPLAMAVLFGWSLLARAELPVASGSAFIGYNAATGQHTAGAPDALGARDDHAVDWRYTLRPGDSLTQLAQDLLRPPRNALDILRYNNLPDASAAVAGTRLRIPVRWLQRQPQPARVVAVSGSATYRSQLDYRVRPLRQDSLLGVGDEIRTDDGRVTVRLADNSIIRLGPSSSLVFDRMTRFGRTGMVDTRLRLERGTLETHVTPLEQEGSRFEIATPSAVAAVRGTAFRLDAEANSTRLEVTEGRVAFGDSRQQQVIGAGFAAEMGRNGSLRIRRLPAAPQLAAVPPEVETLPLEIRWADQPGAAAYKVNLINRESGEWVASIRTPDPRRALTGLQNGRYRIEVAAVTPDGLTGQAASANFSVGLQARAAALKTPVDEAHLKQEDALAFRWDFRGDNEVGRVEVSRQADFNNIIASSEWGDSGDVRLKRELAPGEYFWRVVTEAGGSSVATSDVRRLVVTGALAPPEILNITYAGNQVRIVWRDVPKADRYLLQLAHDPGFENVIKEARIGDNTAALRLAPGQRYFVRLRGLTEGPLESRWGSGRELYVE